MLLGPFVKMVKRLTEKPKMVFVLDNSKSVIAADDSAQVKEKFAFLNGEGVGKALDDFDVSVVSFDEKVGNGLDFSGASTDLGAVLSETTQRFKGMNVAAMVLATDGIYNKGINPTYQNELSNSPLFTLGVGDTTIPRDVAIENIIHNDVVYKGNDYPVKVAYSATNTSERELTLALYKGGTRIKETKVVINPSPFYGEHTFMLSASDLGVVRYDASLEQLDDEKIVSNNRKSAFIEVIEAERTVLVLAEGPHPDVGMLNRMLDRNRNYKADVKYLDGGPLDVSQDELRKYHLVIAQNYPRRSSNDATLKTLKQANVPVLFMTSGATDFARLSNANFGIKALGSGASSNDAHPVLVGGFSLFDVEKQEVEVFSKYPPVSTPMVKFSFAGEVNPMLNQKIGNVESSYQMLTFWSHNNTKYGIFTGSNIWRWASHNFKNDENYTHVDDLFGKMVQYLTVKADRRQFKVKLGKRIFSENERIRLTADLLDKNLNPYTKGSIELLLTEENGKEYSFSFSNRGNNYAADLGTLPSGSYTYKAVAQIGKEKFNASGAFVVKALNKELTKLTANHQLLRQLSANTNGRFFKLNEFDALMEELKQPKFKTSVIKEKEQLSQLIDEKWIAILIIMLMGLEWGVRKFLGSY